MTPPPPSSYGGAAPASKTLLTVRPAQQDGVVPRCLTTTAVTKSYIM